MILHHHSIQNGLLPAARHFFTSWRRYRRLLAASGPAGWSAVRIISIYAFLGTLTSVFNRVSHIPGRVIDSLARTFHRTFFLASCDSHRECKNQGYYS
jgi:hypothetical protein